MPAAGRPSRQAQLRAGEVVAASIAEKVRDRRRELGMSQDGLAAAAGISRPTVARIEAGQDANLASITSVFDVLGLRLEVVAE